MTRPRLLVIGPTPPPVHGTAVYTRMLLESEALREAFDVRHLDISDRRSIQNLGRLDPVNVWLGLRHVLELALRVLRDRPDVVYVEVSQNALAYLRDACFIGLARAGGARVVTHLHGGHFGPFYRGANPLVRALVRVSSRWVDRAWVLGEGLRHHYEGLVDDARVRVVPNGVPDTLGGGAPGSPGRNGRPTVLYLSQLSLPKGVLDLVEAVGRLPAARRPRVVLAGAWRSPEDRRAVRERVEALGLEDRLEDRGVVTGEAKARAFAEADVFVLPTAYPYEGQPLAILEAMAAGLPVVSTARGAIPDMVVEGETGFLVPENDPEALAAMLERLLEDADGRRRMGEAGRRLWEARFTDRRCIARFIAEATESSRGAAALPAPS